MVFLVMTYTQATLDAIARWEWERDNTKSPNTRRKAIRKIAALVEALKELQESGKQ